MRIFRRTLLRRQKALRDDRLFSDAKRAQLAESVGKRHRCWPAFFLRRLGVAGVVPARLRGGT